MNRFQQFQFALIFTLSLTAPRVVATDCEPALARLQSQNKPINKTAFEGLNCALKNRIPARTRHEITITPSANTPRATLKAFAEKYIEYPVDIFHLPQNVRQNYGYDDVNRVMGFKLARAKGQDSLHTLKALRNLKPEGETISEEQAMDILDEFRTFEGSQCYLKAFGIEKRLEAEGIERRNIWKFYAAGDMDDPVEGVWRYHVAVVTQLDNGSIVVLDPLEDSTLSIDEWVKKINDRFDRYVANSKFDKARGFKHPYFVVGESNRLGSASHTTSPESRAELESTFEHYNLNDADKNLIEHIIENFLEQ